MFPILIFIKSEIVHCRRPRSQKQIAQPSPTPSFLIPPNCIIRTAAAALESAGDIPRGRRAVRLRVNRVISISISGRSRWEWGQAFPTRRLVVAALSRPPPTPRKPHEPVFARSESMSHSSSRPLCSPFYTPLIRTELVHYYLLRTLHVLTTNVNNTLLISAGLRDSDGKKATAFKFIELLLLLLLSPIGRVRHWPGRYLFTDIPTKKLSL